MPKKPLTIVPPNVVYKPAKKKARKRPSEGTPLNTILLLSKLLIGIAKSFVVPREFVLLSCASVEKH